MLSPAAGLAAEVWLTRAIKVPRSRRQPSPLLSHHHPCPRPFLPSSVELVPWSSHARPGRWRLEPHTGGAPAAALGRCCNSALAGRRHAGNHALRIVVGGAARGNGKYAVVRAAAIVRGSRRPPREHPAAGPELAAPRGVGRARHGRLLVAARLGGGGDGLLGASTSRSASAASLWAAFSRAAAAAAAASNRRFAAWAATRLLHCGLVLRRVVCIVREPREPCELREPREPLSRAAARAARAAEPLSSRCPSSAAGLLLQQPAQRSLHGSGSASALAPAARPRWRRWRQTPSARACLVAWRWRRRGRLQRQGPRVRVEPWSC